MSEIRLFRLQSNVACEIPGSADTLEKSLQACFEQNLETLLGVRFLSSEYSTGQIHGGRIDSLGIDENGSPVILEYKRAVSENVVNQGLYYLDWLMDHKADFKLLVLERLGKDVADGIDWSGPRLICIASDYTKFDEHAIRQMNRNIDLVRYRRFGPDLLALELESKVSETNSQSAVPNVSPGKSSKGGGDKPVAQAIEEMDEQMRDLYESLRAFTLGLGDDVNQKTLKLYVAFRRIKNFLTVCVQKKNLCLYAHLDPSTVEIESGFTRDMREIGHWGTGDLEIVISSMSDLRRAQPLIERAYEGG